jgi:ParB family chromosome partitioning protein
VSEKRRGLGRGLGALIPVVPPTSESSLRSGEARPVDMLIPEKPLQVDALEEQPVGGHFAELPIEQVFPNARQPRQVFDEEDLAELVHSLKEVGLLQPIVVRPAGDGNYELVMGERRWRAAQQAGFTTIPAIVRETEDQSMLRDALLENLHRSPLNPLEEAAAYDQLLGDFSCTYEELAQRIGRSRPQISNTLRLLKLPSSVQRKVAAGVLTAGHARALLAFDTEQRQVEVADRIVAEGLSVRTVEEMATMVHDTESDPERRPKTHRLVSPRLVEIADHLSTHLETRVKVDLGRHKGRVAIEFATLEDLERILGILDPELIASLPSRRSDRDLANPDAATDSSQQVVDLRGSSNEPAQLG